MTEGTHYSRVTSPKTISTSTHVLLVWSAYDLGAGWSTFFQAFALPPSDTYPHFISAPTPLNHSHFGIATNMHVGDIALLHNSILDPTTQDVLISIQVRSGCPAYPFVSHGILRLTAAPTSCDHDSEIGTLTFQLLRSFGQHSRMPLFKLNPSLNGIGRVFYISLPEMFLSALEYGLHTDSDDDDDEHTTKIVEYPSILSFPTEVPHIQHYDPYSGRICLLDEREKYSVVDVFDLGV